ncbi:PREDICTED: adenosine receptor A3-like [Nanorana parkeri]|uniref:adenosine receptor A3-like n=1 Tax=Nanorana parkeri TaxID=125878 RepID=UPI000854EB15|nr:PREDICTED: adenosine receptor A3-like [Nanorana parkeri]
MNVTALLEMANKTDLSYSTAYIAVETVIGISAILGNILVIWAVKINSSLQNTTFFFIVSLAFADLAVGVLVMPLAIIVSLGMVLPFYSCLFMCCLMVILTNASILSLLAVSIDRYLRIKIPTRYKIVITPRRICLSIWLVWIVSVLVGLVPMFGWNKKSNSDYLACQFLSVMRMDYMVYFSIFGWVFLPMIIILALYIEIFYLIRKHIRKNMSNTRSRGIFYGREYKTAKSLALVFLLFAISWLPLSILNCYLYFTQGTKHSSALKWFISVAILLSHANSAMNPIVYAFKIKKFKDSYTQIIRTYILHRVMISESSSGEHTLDEISQEIVE